MNGDKYNEITEQIKTTDERDKKMDYMATMLCMIATNDLNHIYKAIKGLRWLFVVVLLAVLFSDQITMTKLFEWILRILG